MEDIKAPPALGDPADGYWPAWAEAADLPTFRVRDTESSHGRYSTALKVITVKDLVKFHGHACDGLFRGALAMSQVLAALDPSGEVDRTDLKVLSRNSPCLGDVAAYLTGGRVRFGTQDVRPDPGVWFVVQKISTGEAFAVEEVPGTYPPRLSAMEAELALAGRASPREVDELREAQWAFVRTTLLTTPAAALYPVRALPGFVFPPVPYAHVGPRTDVLFKRVPLA